MYEAKVFGTTDVMFGLLIRRENRNAGWIATGIAKYVSHEYDDATFHDRF